MINSTPRLSIAPAEIPFTVESPIATEIRIQRTQSFRLLFMKPTYFLEQ